MIDPTFLYYDSGLDNVHISPIEKVQTNVYLTFGWGYGIKGATIYTYKTYLLLKKN